MPLPPAPGRKARNCEPKSPMRVSIFPHPEIDPMLEYAPPAPITPIAPNDTGFVACEPVKPEPARISDEELDRIRLGSDGGPLCD